MSQKPHLKMSRFHIVWMTGEQNEQGTYLSTGITLEAYSMLEALSYFHKEISLIEPIYILNMDQTIHKN